MTRFCGRSLAALVLTLGFAAAAPAQELGATTEGLLKELQVPYVKVKPGLYKFLLETQLGTSTILAEEMVVGKDKKGADRLLVRVFTEVITTPATYVPSKPFLTYIAEANLESFFFGSVGMAKNQDGSHILIRMSSAFLSGLDAEGFAGIIVTVHNSKLNAKKALLKILEEAK